MSKLKNDESSAVQSPNIAAPLSENPTSNEAEGGTMNTTTGQPAAMATAEEYAYWVSLAIGGLEIEGAELSQSCEYELLNSIKDHAAVVADLRWLADLIEANHANFIDEIRNINAGEDADFIEDGATPAPGSNFVDMTPEDEAIIKSARAA